MMRFLLLMPVLLLWVGCPSCIHPDPGVAGQGGTCDMEILCDTGLACSDGVCVLAPGTSSGGPWSGVNNSGASGSGVAVSGTSGVLNSSGPSTADAGRPECRIRLDCPLNGTVDGRDCVDGHCVALTCTADAQCGRRYCVNGSCGDRTTCQGDGDCPTPGDICESSVCVAGCTSNAECTGGGGLGVLNACSNGRCGQRCLGDATCLTDPNGVLCENNVCVRAQCTTDVQCQSSLGPNFGCQPPGRCVAYAPCANTGDCPTGNACTNSRCVPLPPCHRDADCAPQGLCEAGFCHPASSCASGAACPPGTQCLGQTCAPAVECRGDVDCVAPRICRAAACTLPPTATVARVIISTPLGLCDPLLDARAACTLTVVPGDSLSLRALALDAAGRLISGVSMTWASDSSGVASVLSGPAAESVVTAETSAGTAHLTAAVLNVVSPALSVINAGASSDAVRVSVVDSRNGLAVFGAAVLVNAVPGITGANGMVTFAASEVSAPFTVSVFHAQYDYLTLVALPAPNTPGALEVLLPLDVAVAGSWTAGLRGGVNLTNASSTGPVAFSLSGVSVASVPGLSFAQLLGESFNVAVTLPVLGSQVFPLPGGLTVSADVPVLGTQSIKGNFDALGTGGRRVAWTFGGRLPLAAVQGLVGAQSSVGALFALAPYFEGLTHGLQTGLLLTSLPYVVDGDTEFDGVDDVNNNGDLTELVPDYDAFPDVQLTVRQEQTLRTVVTVAGIPGNAVAGEALITAGARVPGHGFVPLGLTNARPAGTATSVTKLMKMAPRYGGLETGDCAVAAFAFGNGGLMTMRTVNTNRLDTATNLGTLLPFPVGATYTLATSSLVLPAVAGAGARNAVLQGPTGRWRVWVNGDQSVSVSLPSPPNGLPNRAVTGVNVEAVVLGPALADVEQLARLAQPAAQGFSRLPQEAAGVGRAPLTTR